MRRLVTLLIALLLSSLGWAGVAQANEFVVRCDADHSNTVDPIVAPRAGPGSAHLHDFFGNTSTNSYSTYDSMVNTTNSPATSCVVSTDTAGYWAPQPTLKGSPLPYLHDSNGDIRAYYLNEPDPNNTGTATDKVSSFPAGLQMIAGDSHATARPASTSVIAWFCGATDGTSTPIRNHPYDCTPYKTPVSQGGNGYCATSTMPNAVCSFVTGVTVRVQFQRCWDGTSTEENHVSYASRSACLAVTGQRYLPQLSTRFHLGTMNPCYTSGAQCTADNAPDSNIALAFSSGPYYTIHADFWNTWQQASLNSFVQNCLNSVQEGSNCRFLAPQ